MAPLLFHSLAFISHTYTVARKTKTMTRTSLYCSVWNTETEQGYFTIIQLFPGSTEAETSALHYCVRFGCMLALASCDVNRGKPSRTCRICDSYTLATETAEATIQNHLPNMPHLPLSNYFAFYYPKTFSLSTDCLLVTAQQLPNQTCAIP